MEVFNFFEVLGAIFLIQTCLYLVFLIFSPPSKSNYLLIALLSTLVLLIINLFIRFHGNPKFPYFYYEFSSLLAPLQYFYTKSLVNKDFKLSFNDSAHVLGVLLLLAFRVFTTTDFISSNALDFDRIFFFPLFTYLFIYLILSFKVINKFHKIILLTRSNSELYSLKWLKIELIMLGVLFITMGIESFDLFIDLGNYYYVAVLLSFVSLMLFINILTFKSLRAPMYLGIDKDEKNVFDAQKNKYIRSQIDSKKSKALFNGLILLMETKKPYSEYGLSLSLLATMLNVKSTDLSQIINENSNMNFNDFINSYRVEKAKSLMAKKEDWLIKEIMFESGFQSTSTFNSAFKKFTGKNPSGFYKQFKNRQ